MLRLLNLLTKCATMEPQLQHAAASEITKCTMFEQSSPPICPLVSWSAIKCTTSTALNIPAVLEKGSCWKQLRRVNPKMSWTSSRSNRDKSYWNFAFVAKVCKFIQFALDSQRLLSMLSSNSLCMQRSSLIWEGTTARIKALGSWFNTIDPVTADFQHWFCNSRQP